MASARASLLCAHLMKRRVVSRSNFARESSSCSFWIAFFSSASATFCAAFSEARSLTRAVARSATWSSSAASRMSMIFAVAMLQPTPAALPPAAVARVCETSARRRMRSARSWSSSQSLYPDERQSVRFCALMGAAEAARPDTEAPISRRIFLVSFRPLSQSRISAPWAPSRMRSLSSLRTANGRRPIFER